MSASKPECVIALAYGYRRSHGRVLPGPSNEQLAKLVHSEYGHLPKILQFEVAEALREFDNEPVMRIEQHRSGAYLDTREVLLQAAALCKKSGWETVALVCHPLHLPRVKRVAEKLGLKTDRAQIAAMTAAEIEYDSSSEQSWTRSAPSMRVHETLATALYKAKRYI